MSIAGGVEQAILRGHSIGCQTIQLFTKNNNQWQGKVLNLEEVELFKRERSRKKIHPILAHDAYLINLASPNSSVHKKSLAAFTQEIIRAEQLGIDFLVMHPGAHWGKGEEWGLQRIAESMGIALENSRSALKEFPRVPSISNTQMNTNGSAKGNATGNTNPVRVLLEITAGQGSCVGYKFEHLAEILRLVNQPQRMGVCLDTCHLFAAGYDIRTKKGYQEVMGQLKDVIGLEAVKAFHLNDSKKGLGSRVDRHEHIGRGAIGLEGFRCLLRDQRFHGIPMVLETPKGPDLKEDVENLEVLKSLME